MIVRRIRDGEALAAQLLRPRALLAAPVGPVYTGWRDGGTPAPSTHLSSEVNDVRWMVGESR